MTLNTVENPICKNGWSFRRVSSFRLWSRYKEHIVDIAGLVYPHFSSTAVGPFFATGRWPISSRRRVCKERIQEQIVETTMEVPQERVQQRTVE